MISKELESVFVRRLSGELQTAAGEPLWWAARKVGRASP